MQRKKNPDSSKVPQAKKRLPSSTRLGKNEPLVRKDNPSGGKEQEGGVTGTEPYRSDHQRNTEKLLRWIEAVVDPVCVDGPMRKKEKEN